MFLSYVSFDLLLGACSIHSLYSLVLNLLMLLIYSLLVMFESSFFSV